MHIVADPTIVSRKTGLTVFPRQMMEDGHWTVALDSLELACAGAVERLRPFLHSSSVQPEHTTPREIRDVAPVSSQSDDGDDRVFLQRGFAEKREND